MIWITGASSGIGEACARKLARGIGGQKPSGMILTARRLDRLQAIGTEIEAATGVKVHCFALDVTDFAAVREFGIAQATLLDALEVLVNNAGLARWMDLLQDGKWEDWEEMIDTNVKGFLAVTHVVLPRMASRRRGHIVNMGSVAGHWTYPKGSVYCATKYAVNALNEGMRLDLNGTGVRVTQISPGLVETEFSQVRFRENGPRAQAVYQGLTALTPADVADTVEWALSRPGHVNVQEIVLYPTDQASPTIVNRSIV